MSTKSRNPYAARPGDEPEDVLFNSIYGLRSMELNRPKALNALNGSMIRKIMPRLLEWEKSDMANVVVMKGAGEKALCAGGDVMALAEMNQNGAEGQKASADYFAEEYQLDHLIATYSKPYISFMDGITMGGGVGLSIHAPLRIATERTVFAMPETTIGFFPDVGASFFLPRMNGSIGTYLALTSDRLSGADVFYSGIATHYLHSTSLHALESRLAELRFKDEWDMATRLDLINATIEEFCTGLPYDKPMLLAGELRRAVDRCFSKATVEEILQALAAEDGATKDWAQKTITTLHKRSPTAVHVTLKQMQVGRQWDIAQTFKEEHKIATKFMEHGDFTTGVLALLKHKGKVSPEWKPATLEDIKPGQDVTQPFFDAPASKPFLLGGRRSYNTYPYPQLGLPTEQEVYDVVARGSMKQREVVNYFIGQRKGKQGVKEVMEDIVNRKTVQGQDGKAQWRND